jgi:hypothetical protein
VSVQIEVLRDGKFHRIGQVLDCNPLAAPPLREFYIQLDGGITIEGEHLTRFKYSLSKPDEFIAHFHGDRLTTRVIQDGN